MAEIIEEFDPLTSQKWLREHGLLCFRHGRELIEKLPSAWRSEMEQTMSQKVGELEKELDEFLAAGKKRRAHGRWNPGAGGGVPGGTTRD